MVPRGQMAMSAVRCMSRSPSPLAGQVGCGLFTACPPCSWGESGAGSVCSVLRLEGGRAGDWCGGPVTSPELSDVASSPPFWENYGEDQVFHV